MVVAMVVPRYGGLVGTTLGVGLGGCACEFIRVGAGLGDGLEHVLVDLGRTRVRVDVVIDADRVEAQDTIGQTLFRSISATMSEPPR